MKNFTVKAAAGGYLIFKRFKTKFLLTNIYNVLGYAVNLLKLFIASMFTHKDVQHIGAMVQCSSFLRESKVRPRLETNCFSTDFSFYTV